MGNCKNVCRLCDRLVISTAVTFTGGNLIINIPAGNYAAGCKYCIVVAQAIPVATTINAPVFVTIGAAATQYALNRCDCVQATACAIRTRTKYAVCVNTTATGGSFKLLGRLLCVPNDVLTSLPAAAAATAEGDGN